MSGEEYSALKLGDKVWCFKIFFNDTLYGTLGMGLIVELEKMDEEDKFKVIQVKKGTSSIAKVGNIIKVGRWVYSSELFKDYNDGIDYWNSVVLNEVDHLTSEYEESTKRVKEKLLKKK